MLKTSLLTFFLIMSIFNGFSQYYNWSKSFGGTSADVLGDQVIDQDGNVYTIGSFVGTVDFNPNSGLSNFTSQGEKDIFIQKLDANGNFLWARTFGGVSYDEGKSIAIDSLGNVYATGCFSGTVDFDPGAGSVNKSSSGNSKDIFVLKLNSSGDFVWVRTFGSIAADLGCSIDLDPYQNIIISGLFGFSVNFDPGPGSTMLNSNGGLDIFIQKLDEDGNLIWVKSFGGNSDERLNNTISDFEGNIFTVGYFNGTVDFDPGTSTANLSSPSNFDLFIQKLDSSGSYVWSKTFQGISHSSPSYKTISTDLLGNVYVTGYFAGTRDMDPGSGVAYLTANVMSTFVLKMSSMGEHLWSKALLGHISRGQAIQTDSVGNAFIIGDFFGTVDFNPGMEEVMISSRGNSDIYVLKLDSLGDFVWVNTFGGNALDHGKTISVNKSGSIYASGEFDGAISFSSGSGPQTYVSNGNDDIFVFKMGQVAPAGFSELLQGTSFSVYPNPTAGRVQLSFSEPLNNIDISLIDTQGKVVFHIHKNFVADEQITIEGKPGVYYLKVKSEESESVIKLVKE